MGNKTWDMVWERNKIDYIFYIYIEERRKYREESFSAHQHNSAHEKRKYRMDEVREGGHKRYTRNNNNKSKNVKRNQQNTRVGKCIYIMLMRTAKPPSA
jgi:hypothetical protein